MIEMSMFLSIQALAERGMGKKKIARRLGLDVRTVRKYIRRIGLGDREPRRVPAPSKLDPLQPLVEQKIQEGLSATQIYQDLCLREDFDASYGTVQRLVRKLRTTEPEVYCRMRYVPGEEGQIDFGEIGRLPVGGKRRKVYLFVMTLCYSRLAYYELVLDQTVPTFLMAIRHAVEFLGVVPARLKPDNLRSAVLIDHLGQRYYQEDFFRFCQHYGMIPDAARPFTATDKGRVERDIGYAKSSCFRGRTFASFEEAVAHLEWWMNHVANVRVHGTTRRRPVDLFEEEKAHLLPLPDEPYEICRWGRYRVRKDCHIHVEGNYYSVPYTLVGGQVTVRVGAEDVTAFAEGMIMAQHQRALGKGETITDPAHYPPQKRLGTQEIHRRRCLSIRSAGPHAAEFLHQLRGSRWVFGPQVARLADLVRQHGADAVDQACRRALFFSSTDGADVIRRILEQDLHTIPLPEDAPCGSGGQDYGRPLVEYAALLAWEEVSHE
jgi:transposase